MSQSVAVINSLCSIYTSRQMALRFTPEHSRPRPQTQGQGRTITRPTPKNLALRPKPRINIPVNFFKHKLKTELFTYKEESNPSPKGAITYIGDPTARDGYPPSALRTSGRAVTSRWWNCHMQFMTIVWSFTNLTTLFRRTQQDPFLDSIQEIIEQNWV